MHERLRQAREQKGWSLDELSRRAGLRPRTIALIDSGQFAELPAGLYCRSSIRSYAVAVGLNPDEIIEALRPLLPSAEDPLDGLARRCGHARKVESRSAEMAAAPAPAAAVDVFEPPVMIAPPPEEWDAVYAAAPKTDDEMIVEGAETGTDRPGDAGRQWWRPVLASGFDGLILAAIGAGLVWLTAQVGATTVPIVLRSGAPGIALVFALIVALYFVLFGGVGNATPGGRLMRLEDRPAGRIVLNPREVFGRACRSIYQDHTLVTD